MLLAEIISCVICFYLGYVHGDKIIDWVETKLKIKK